MIQKRLNGVVLSVLTSLKLLNMKVMKLLNSKNEMFSALCGEDFTNKEVILSNLAAVALVIACIIAERIAL